MNSSLTAFPVRTLLAAGIDALSLIALSHGPRFRPANGLERAACWSGMLTKTLAVIVSAVILAPDAAAKVRVGDIPPPLLGTDRNGDRVDLAQMSGKIVVIAFWSPRCRICLKELPVLEAIHNSVGEDELEVIAVSAEDERTYRIAARRLKDYRMTLVHDRRGHVQGRYGVNMVIVGTDGRVVSALREHSEDIAAVLVDELNKLLPAQPSADSPEP